VPIVRQPRARAHWKFQAIVNEPLLPVAGQARVRSRGHGAARFLLLSRWRALGVIADITDRAMLLPVG
jgi:hypothetical protein